MSAGPSPFYKAAASLEDARVLDRAVDIAEPVVERLVGREPVRSTLSGRWLGHALHPLLTDLPLGSWLSACVLDLIGGPSSRTASRRLLGFGIATAIPTMAAGWTDWLSANRRQRKVGIAHAVVNSTALGCYTTSLICRRRGHHGVGVTIGMVGGLIATVGGYLGGHLSLARDTGLRATAATGVPTDLDMSAASST
jgi:uncharacterized membrane protein